MDRLGLEAVLGVHLEDGFHQVLGLDARVDGGVTGTHLEAGDDFVESGGHNLFVPCYSSSCQPMKLLIIYMAIAGLVFALAYSLTRGKNGFGCRSDGTCDLPNICIERSCVVVMRIELRPLHK